MANSKSKPADEAIEELLRILEQDEPFDAGKADAPKPTTPPDSADHRGLFLDAGDDSTAPVAPSPFLGPPSEPDAPPAPGTFLDQPNELQEAIPSLREAPVGRAIPPAVKPTNGEATPPKSANSRQMIAAEKYDQWLSQWRQSPESKLPWLAGLRERLEKLAQEGGEMETHAMMAALRLGASAEAEHILELASRTTRVQYRLASLYPWLDPATRRELFKLAGKSKDASDILPNLLEKARRFDPQHAGQAYWQSLQRVELSALQDSWQLRQKLMLVTVGSEYLRVPADERLEPVAAKLASRIKDAQRPAARLIGLSVLGELSPEKVTELVGDDFRDVSIDQRLRRDWARMALANRGEQDAITLALEMMEDDVLLPVAMAFLTESYEGVSETEVGSVEVSGVDADSYSYGKLRIAKISPSIEVRHVKPFLDHADSEVVARATYAMVVLGEDVDIAPLIQQARFEGLSEYLSGMTNLLVMAIAFRNADEEVPILEEVYNLMSLDNEYYIRDFYWKIRIMDGPKALALRKRIREEISMSKLT